MSKPIPAENAQHFSRSRWATFDCYGTLIDWNGGIRLELAIVASELGSYKPGVRHWERFFEQVDVPRARHVHVAQSHHHDVVPAHRLGLQTVWINRYGERHEPAPTRELHDLSRLPETLDELVAA